jgi:hypothetical protein
VAVEYRGNGVVVFARIDSGSLYKTGHMANRWFGGVMRSLERHVTEAAPIREGTLKYGIRESTHRVAEHTLEGTLESRADHTMYVLRGTGFPARGRAGSIYSRRAFDSGRKRENAYVQVTGVVSSRTGKFSTRATKGRRVTIKQGLPGHWLAFGPDAFGPRIIAFSVSGQDANNFLLEGWTATARSHRSMRRIPSFVLNP